VTCVVPASAGGGLCARACVGEEMHEVETTAAGTVAAAGGEAASTSVVLPFWSWSFLRSRASFKARCSVNSWSKGLVLCATARLSDRA